MAPALAKGATGRAVGLLQLRLGLPRTEVFDDATDGALRAAQAKHGLVVDGIYGPKTNAALVSRGPRDLANAAALAGVDLPSFTALTSVETASSGFLDDGRPKILLERHYVYRMASPAQRERLGADVCYPTPGGYLGVAAEWDRFERVSAVAGPVVAIQACSWGLGQIMGANFARTGAASAAAFMLASSFDERSQLELLARFVKADSALIRALNARDWPTVAKRYNGPGNIDVYAAKLAAAFKVS